MNESLGVHPSISRVHALEPTIRPSSDGKPVVVSVAHPSVVSSGTGSNARCTNCGAERTGAFCHVCGQRYRDERLTVRRVLQDLTTRFLDVESGFLHTVYRLTVAPGTVARDYVAGRRQRYVGPATYLIVITTVSILAFALVKADYIQFIEATWIAALPETMFASEQGVIQSDEFAATLTRWLSQGTLYLSLFMAGFFAVVMRGVLPRWRQRYNGAETWVFAIYATAHGFLLSLPLYSLALLDLELVTRFMLIAWLLMVGTTVYMAVAASQFLDGRWSTGLIAGGAYLATFLLASWISAGIGFAVALLMAG
jgi:hypothetical protein